MIDIKKIIQQFSKEDINEFRHFISRQKNKTDRKDLKLFNILLENKKYSSADMVKKLYNDSSKGQAYHALRKRLLKHIRDFVVVKQMDADSSTLSKIMGLISLSRYLFNKRADELAWKFLKDAENLAIKSEQFLILNGIYLLQIEQSDSDFADNLYDIIEKRDKNKATVEEEEKVTIALSEVKDKLKFQRKEGTESNLIRSIQKVSVILKKYDLDERLAESPRLLHAVLSILRGFFLGRKHMPGFGEYAQGLYEESVKNSKFARHNHSFKLGILYIIIHSFYRDFEFEKSSKYLDIFHEELMKYSRQNYSLFYPRYLMLKAAVDCMVGKNEESIKLLKGVINNKDVKLNIKDELNIRMNLSVYYLIDKEYDEMSYVFSRVRHGDDFMEKKMGKEWLIKKRLLEVASYAESGPDYADIAENKIISILKSKSFKVLAKHTDAFKRGEIFLLIVKKYIRNPEWLTREVFDNEIRAKLEVEMNAKEDLQVTFFFSWLMAKAYKQDFYETILDVIERARNEDGNKGMTKMI